MESPDQNPYLSLWGITNCKYTSCYCEENVYLLCQDFIKNHAEKIPNSNINHEGFAVFITNKTKSAELRYQKAGKSDKYHTVLWDYHVIFIHKVANQENTLKSYVYDLDTTLNSQKTLTNITKLFFRVIDAKSFCETFASDRSHMVIGVKKVGKKFEKVYSSPIPDYPNIVNAKGEKANLDKYWDLDNHDPIYGKVLSQSDFYKFFTSP